MQDSLKTPEQELILYRYYRAIDKSNEEMLQRLFVNSELKFSTVKDFNDPFECRAYTFSFEGSPREETKKWIKNVFFNPLNKSLDDDFKNEFADKICKGEIPPYAEDYLQSIYDRAQNEFLICCFSKAPDSILMWSHYATGHKGFCIKCKISGEAIEINYPDDDYFPKINPYLVAHGREDITKKMFLTKSKYWKYEQEYRLVTPIKEKRYEQQKKDFLQGVIYGWKMEQKDKDQIKAWVNQGESNPEYFHAIGHKDKFELDILPIK